jgi:mannose-6-phosphate isomerase-like protein (cupin superfamily)
MTKKNEFYPDMIRKLPQIDINIDGVKGWLLQGKEMQTVYFEIEPVGIIPPHSHCSQWGLMLDGKMKFTIDGVTRIYQKGDRYFIPAGVVHSAEFLTKVYVIDHFDDPRRYSPKLEK